MKYLRRFNEQTSNFASMLPQGFVQAEMTGGYMVLGDYKLKGDSDHNLYYCQTNKGKIVVFESISKKGENPFGVGFIYETNGKPNKVGYSASGIQFTSPDTEKNPPISERQFFTNPQDVINHLNKKYPQSKVINLAGSKTDSKTDSVGGKALSDPDDSQVVEQSVFDAIKKTLKDPLKKGGMYLITNSDEFKELTRLKGIQQHKLDVEIKKYGEVYSIRGAASEKMVNVYNDNIILLDKTIEQYLNGDMTAIDVKDLLDDKIKEVQGLPTLNIPDANAFKKAAIDFLTWLRSDVAKWLI